MRDDLIYLRRSIGHLTAAILGGVSMVLIAAYLQYRSDGDFRDLTEKAHKVQARISGFSAELARVQAGLTVYERLLAQGFIGPEQRQQWLERLGSISSARRLLALRYEFQPQSGANAAWGGNDVGDGYKLMVSTMTLQLDLLHENDLIGLLADLRASVGAWLLARECRIDRLPELGDGADRVQARLRAQCAIDWATLREAS
jgi:hypothetical protein